MLGETRVDGCNLRFPGSGLAVREYGTVESREDLLEKGSNNLVEEHSLSRFWAEYISSWNRVSVRIVAFFAKVVRLGCRGRERDVAGGGEEWGGICESDGVASNWIGFRHERLFCCDGEEFPAGGECQGRGATKQEGRAGPVAENDLNVGFRCFGGRFGGSRRLALVRWAGVS